MIPRLWERLPTSHDPQRLVLGLLLCGWLVWTVYWPERIPLYGVHLSNVRLEREVRTLSLAIGRLETERKLRLRFLDRLAWDTHYWEACARRAGMTLDRERRIDLKSMAGSNGPRD